MKKVAHPYEIQNTNEGSLRRYVEPEVDERPDMNDLGLMLKMDTEWKIQQET